VAAVEAGAMKAIPLAVAGAFHTEVMQAAVEPLRQVLENVTLNAPRIPVISNVDASVHSDPEIIRQHLVQQVVSPVRWEECMGTLLNKEINQFYEIGPGRVLRGLLRRIARKTRCENVSC
jgi:[acyl-carrier-protein] S-malonyltransferase